ncbi:hypothetical protein MDA_GLEAN10002717 [Myotis davidii]|uniref:Uncharacterized protein n=1 Tax=Myotis davidii TaxID=225400 RepID=L5ML68_MYODS|nr:hypothetical protein MDA_GLEAN10002717 [Myotis davidii]
MFDCSLDLLPAGKWTSPKGSRAASGMSDCQLMPISRGAGLSQQVVILRGVPDCERAQMSSVPGGNGSRDPGLSGLSPALGGEAVATLMGSRDFCWLGKSGCLRLATHVNSRDLASREQEDS